MSTYSFHFKMRKGIILSISSVLAGVLLALLLVLPSVAFAASSPSSSHITAPPDSAQKAFDRASVSVVRLIVTYGTGANAVACTGLGTLVGSWATQLGGEVTNWVLTDGSLVNPSGGTCAGKNSSLLAMVQVLVNNRYTSNNPTSSSLGTFSLLASDVTCASGVAVAHCASGPALFSFKTSTQLQLYVDPAPANAPPTTTIALINSTSAAVLPSVSGPGDTQQTYLTKVQPFLTPMAVTPVKGQELGTPLFNSDGQITQLWLSGATVGTDVVSFLTSKLLPQKPSGLPAVLNPLKTGWDAGIDSYYASHFSDAVTAFKAIALVNPNFKAATDFATTAQADQVALTAQNNSATATATTAQKSGSHLAPGTGGPDFFGIPFFTWVVGSAVCLLLIIGVLIWLTVRKLRMHKFNKEATEAKENAPRKAEELRLREAQRTTEPILPVPSPLNNIPPIQQASPVLSTPTSPQQYSPVREAPCPNCRKMIRIDSEFCTYCRTPLTASASGRFNAQQQPASPIAPGQAVPPYAPSSGPLPALPPYPNPSPAYEQTYYPPVPLPQGGTGNGQSAPTIEAAPEPTVRYGHGRNLSLAVGTQTDRGKKRQHKENEDSIFAAEGVRKNNTAMQQFGLFVVADGMGGHANGQDASRLAIHSIIHYLLPILSQTEELSDEGYLKLLTEGVQQANMAVHNRNIEQRADMGTTMTAALVVESTAYIANVGDSRTYLYREGAGLRKVTHDHSVVESLVDAGIIQKDDVYTHPKRNQVYRNLGEKSPVEVDAFKEPLLPGDKLLLCSDGLWEMVRDPNIEHILKNLPTNPGEASTQLLQAALDGGGEDNVSLIVVQIAGSSKGDKSLKIHLLAKPDTVEVPKIDIPIIMPS